MMINKEDDDDIIIVQCKNYESKNICVKDLSGFSFLNILYLHIEILHDH